MRVLIISTNRFRQPWPVMPIGACMVASAVEHAGHQVRFLDLCFSEDCIADTRRALEEFQPECVGISIRNMDNCVGYRPQFLLDEQRPVIEFVKAQASCPIILGGAALFINGREILEYFDLPYACIGDGELVFVEALERIARKESLLGVPGLIIRSEGAFVQDEPYDFAADVNALPPYSIKRFLDLSKYAAFEVSIQVQTKRGCALRCSYCPNKLMEGHRYRLVDPQRLADQIERLVQETGIRQIEFVDSTFNIPLRHAKEVLRAIIAKDLGLRLNALGLNPAGIDEEFADLMEKAGFQTATVNIDAGCDAILEDMQKNFDTERVRKAAAILRQKRMTIAWYLLLGAEAETYSTLMETLDFVKRVASVWDAVFIAVGLRVYRGSPIADRMLAVDPAVTSDGFFKPVVVHPKGIALEDLYAVARHYAIQRPNFIIYNDEATPEFVIKLGFKIVRRWFPRLPVWRLHIFGQVINKVTGLLLAQQLAFGVRHRKQLRRARATGTPPAPQPGLV